MINSIAFWLLISLELYIVFFRKLLLFGEYLDYRKDTQLFSIWNENFSSSISFNWIEELTSWFLRVIMKLEFEEI